MRRVLWIAVLCLASRVLPAVDVDALKSLALEDLADIQVSIASRGSHALKDTAAAVYVITHEDIVRSPADSVAELLRDVPGLNVARIDANTWAVSIRGFNGRYANKLLVLVDGRSVYTPLFSGVYWILQDMLVEDIDRIEVIRGPGASVWGANAVNGVINIITRSSEDTRGSLVSVTGGDPQTQRIGLRHGGAIDSDTDYRLWVQRRAHRNGHFDTGREANDGGRDDRLGFRVDGLTDKGDSYNVSGGLYRNEAGVTANVIDMRSGFSVPVDRVNQSHGGHLSASWQRMRERGGDELKLYYDWNWYDATRERFRVLDIEYLAEYPLGETQAFNWGLGYRWVSDSVAGQPLFLEITPADHDRHLYSLFAEDQIQLAERWSLALSARLEYSNVSGVDLQPSARLLWKPRDDVSLWAAVSRATRTPAVAERHIFAPVLGTPADPPERPLPVVGAFVGNPAYRSEQVTTWEMGYRAMPTPQVSIDLAIFYSRYRDLRSVEPGALVVNPLSGYVLLPLNVENRLDAASRGLELSLDWRMSAATRLRFNWSWLDLDRQPRADSQDPVSRPGQNTSPEHQLGLALSTRPAAGWLLDLRLRYTGGLPADTQPVADYWALDMQLAWEPAPGFRLALSARNLFDAGHMEFYDELNQRTASTRVDPAYMLKMVWEF